MTKWSHTQFLWCRPPMNKRCSLTLTLPALCLPTMPSAFVFRVGEFLKRCVSPDQTLYWSRCPGHLIKQSVWPANAPFRIQLMAVVFFFFSQSLAAEKLLLSLKFKVPKYNFWEYLCYWMENICERGKGKESKGMEEKRESLSAGFPGLSLINQGRGGTNFAFGFLN